MLLQEFTRTLNAYGTQRIPFLFLVDFEMQHPQVFLLDDINANKLLFDINGHTNVGRIDLRSIDCHLLKYPISFDEYSTKYDLVRSHLAYGDSYLTNLTVKTRIETALSLREIFSISEARYKVWYDNRFLVFSPETFVRIKDGKIRAYPMKGTIDAAVPDAREKILSDAKEMAEHVTIVDLIRNDLSTVADNVEVTRFRYIDEIRTSDKTLLQVSSEIQGDLGRGYESRLGDILVALLPAGSVSGAPKVKTAEIIRKAEAEPRGYYTGIVGLFDGTSFDSGVMIRFIEDDGGTLYYRSGGGITIQSRPEMEYQETIDKVYVPLKVYVPAN